MAHYTWVKLEEKMLEYIKHLFLKGIYMKNLASILAISALVMTTGMSSAHAERVCKVTDPTNTPLNIRDQPNGKIINKLRNEREVYITETSYDDKDRPWVYLEGYYKGEYRQWGWAIREFVSCYDR